MVTKELSIEELIEVKRKRQGSKDEISSEDFKKDLDSYSKEQFIQYIVGLDEYNDDTIDGDDDEY